MTCFRWLLQKVKCTCSFFDPYWMTKVSFVQALCCLVVKQATMAAWVFCFSFLLSSWLWSLRLEHFPDEWQQSISWWQFLTLKENQKTMWKKLFLFIFDVLLTADRYMEEDLVFTLSSVIFLNTKMPTTCNEIGAVLHPRGNDMTIIICHNKLPDRKWGWMAVGVNWVGGWHHAQKRCPENLSILKRQSWGRLLKHVVEFIGQDQTWSDQIRSFWISTSRDELIS